MMTVMPILCAWSLLLAQGRAQALSPVGSAMMGSWVGSLEYRDFSDNSRQTLGTLLRVSRRPEGPGLVFRYVYDDGPNKVVQDKDIVTIDETQATYIVSSEDEKETTRYTIDRLDRLRQDGTGTLILSGSGVENGAKVDVRETLTVSAKRLRLLRESRLPGQSFLFRHAYDFQRLSAFNPVKPN